MVRHFAAFAALLLVACDPIPPDLPPAEPGEIRRVFLQPSQTSTIQFTHLELVNAARAERGLAPLRLSPSLNAAAATHARDMWVQQRAWHFGSDGASPQDRAQRAGFQGLVLGENIAETYMADLMVLETWLANPRARALILDPRATSIGFDWFQERDAKLWWVQVIGTTEEPAPGGFRPQGENAGVLSELERPGAPQGILPPDDTAPSI